MLARDRQIYCEAKFDSCIASHHSSPHLVSLVPYDSFKSDARPQHWLRTLCVKSLVVETRVAAFAGAETVHAYLNKQEPFVGPSAASRR